MADAPTKFDAVIDSRNVIARIEHLEQLRFAGLVDLGDDNKTDQDTLFAELASLEAFMAEMKGNGGHEQWRGDWYPVTAVRDSYFKEFAMEEAENLDLVKPDVGWPYTCIDWDKTPDELQMDYTAVEFDGVTYWVR